MSKTSSRDSHGYAKFANPSPAWGVHTTDWNADEEPNEAETLLRLPELVVSWRVDVLFHAQLRPGETFNLGEPSSGTPSYVLPREVLGRETVRLLGETIHGTALFLEELPASATVDSGAEVLSIDETSLRCASAGWFDEALGMHYLPLKWGPVRVTIGDFHVDCGLTKSERPLPRAPLVPVDGETLTYWGLTFVSAGALLASLAWLTPPLSLTEGERTERYALTRMMEYLDAAAQRERENLELPRDTAGSESGSGARGEMASSSELPTAPTKQRYPSKNTSAGGRTSLAGEQGRVETFGAIGLLASVAGTLTTPAWSRDPSLGSGPNSEGMWADPLGHGAGLGGLALTGTGSGGGVAGEWLGLNGVGTWNGGMGAADSGIGSHHGRLGGSHAARGPGRVRMANALVSGRLPAEVIQRVVRQNHGKIRYCYERGLAGNPSLSGRVAVRFVIGRDGAVVSAANGGASVASSEVVECVVRAFYGLTFPKPQGGLVTVSYPILLSPE
jgi:hypothetical protein